MINGRPRCRRLVLTNNRNSSDPASDIRIWGEMPELFISFTASDKAWADWIAWHLYRAGYSLSYQPWTFAPGSNFVLEMDAAAKRSSHVVVVLSRRYVDSGFAQPEWAEAFGRDPKGQLRRLIPVRIEDFSPTGLLSQIVYLDLANENDQESAARLLLDGVASAIFPRTKSPHPAADDSPPFPGTVAPASGAFPKTANAMQLLEASIPWPGVGVPTSDMFDGPELVGLRAYSDNPLRLDFLLDLGGSRLAESAIPVEALHHIRCFLAALAIPEEDWWVNLTIGQPDRVAPKSLGSTTLGRTLLLQDYLLKQVAASIQNPLTESGSSYWKQVYEAAYVYLGDSVDGFDSLSDAEKTAHWFAAYGASAFDKWEGLLQTLDSQQVASAGLKVLANWVRDVLQALRAFLPDVSRAMQALSSLQTWDELMSWARENDDTDRMFRIARGFLASELEQIRGAVFTVEDTVNTLMRVWIVPKTARLRESDGTALVSDVRLDVQLESDYRQSLQSGEALVKLESTGAISEKVERAFRNLLLPQLAHEVNHGRNFAPMRAAYQSMVFASWFKRALSNTALSGGSVQTQGGSTAGHGVDVYQKYVRSIETGVFKFIHEDSDSSGLGIVPRKYVAGGIDGRATYRAMHTEQGDSPRRPTFPEEHEPRRYWVEVSLVDRGSRPPEGRPSDDLNETGGIDLSSTTKHLLVDTDDEVFKFTDSHALKELKAAKSVELVPVLERITSELPHRR